MRFLLRRYSLLLGVATLVNSGVLAQSIVAHRLDELRVPTADVLGIYHGPRGGMFILTGCDSIAMLLVHDGETWQTSHRLAVDERILPTLSGELLLANATEVFTFEWRFRAPAQRVTIGKLSRPHEITRATYLLSDEQSGRRGYPEVVLETDRTIMVSEGGLFHATTSVPMRLLGVSPKGAFVADAQGAVFAVGQGRQVIAHLPEGLNDIVPIATTASGNILFRGDRTVYALQPDRAEKFRLRNVVEVPPGADVTVVGNQLMSLDPGRPLRSRDLQGEASWQVIPFGGADAQRTSPVAIGGAASFYSIGSRAIVRTQTGVVTVECLPNVVTPIRLDASFTSAIGSAGAKLVVGQPDAVRIFEMNAAKDTKPERSWPTFDNYMRNSVPTCVAAFDERIVVGTSDGRVLALNGDGPPDQLSSVVGYGMEFSDLFVSQDVLWATFNSSSGRNSGLVKITPEGSALQLDSTGLEGSVACIRRAPAGRLYAASRRGASPLHYFFESHNIWMKLEGRIETAASHQGFEIHEIAPLSDSVIYIATSRGLLQWQRGHGYSNVPMPHDLLDADIRSVKPAGGGLWFTVQGQGAYFLRDGNLHTVEGMHNWASLDFQPRGLTTLAAEELVLLNGGRVIRLQNPTQDFLPLRPGIIFSTHAGKLFGARAVPGQRLSLWQGDSLYVHYSLPGFAPDHLVAGFTLDGVTVRPARTVSGLAVFAPLLPGDFEFSIRVISREKGFSASVHTQSVRVMPFWWTSAFGIIVIVLLTSLVAFAIVSVYTLRQRTLARELENLVAERTHDLQIAQDKAQKASAAKSMFLANMSHEIRTPLNAVLGMSNLLLESELSSEQRNFAGAIQRGGNSLHAIVGDILDFAEIDNGTVKRRDTLTNLSELIHELIVGHSDHAFDKGLFFAYDVASLPTHVTTDAQKLRSALRHLLDNAIKFTASGTVRLDVDYDPASAGNQDLLTVRISDTGIGIEPENYRRIFEVFEQADNSNTRRFGGTGLGLTIVRTYAECLGGEVNLESTYGKGSVFSLQIPVRPVVRYAAQCALVRREDQLRIWPASTQMGFESQLHRLFSDGHFVIPASADEVLPGDILVYGFTGVADLGAFRQNALYRRFSEIGATIAIVRSEQHSAWLELQAGEQSVAYPLSPSQLVDLARAWRRERAEQRERDQRPSECASSPHGERADAAGPSVDGGDADAFPPPAAQAKEPANARPVFFDLAAEHPLRILVAEDNLMNKMLILTVLTKLGYTADWVENGRLAIERFAAEAYDLILMDIHMPEMDGLQATREIRKRYFERPVTICALTANASEEGRVECLAAGMDDFMTKPLHVPALVARLRRVEGLASRMLALQNTQSTELSGVESGQGERRDATAQVRHA